MFNPKNMKNVTDVYRQRFVCVWQRRLQSTCDVYWDTSRSSMYLSWRLHRQWIHMHQWVVIDLTTLVRGLVKPSDVRQRNISHLTLISETAERCLVQTISSVWSQAELVKLT